MSAQIVDTIKGLVELDFLSGDIESTEEFNLCYQRLLSEVKQTNDLATARTMRKILLKQADFLMNEWLRQDAKHEAKESQ